MKRFGLIGALSPICLAVFLLAFCWTAARGQSANPPQPDAYAWNNRPPDPRFKTDILVVVAHPDDETLISAYLAREVLDHHKRVAIVYGTHGGGGNNQVGPEQTRALADIRGIEAREADASIGITHVWFLSGRDTYSQDVLASLDHWGHGRCLDELVRIVRITRPTVILTFLPDFVTGENHADHQAAGVLATEAFDLAGNPSAFPEQVSPTTYPNKNANFTEGLRPWQPEKIYYFDNPTHDIFKGQGPQYSVTDISPSRHESYGMLAAQVVAHHETQGGVNVQKAIDNHTLETSSSDLAKLATEPVKLIFGKSLVSSGITDDVFTGVVAGGVPYRRPPGYTPITYTKPVLQIGDPWNFYHRFWRAHGIEHLANVVPLEVTVHTGRIMYIPLVVENPLNAPLPVKLSVESPKGWTVLPVATATVPPHSRYYLRVRAAAPATKLPGWQHFSVTAHSGDTRIGTVSIRAELSDGWVAPQ